MREYGLVTIMTVLRHGEDMGQKSIIDARFSNEPGSSIRVSGVTRKIQQSERRGLGPIPAESGQSMYKSRPLRIS